MIPKNSVLMFFTMIITILFFSSCITRSREKNIDESEVIEINKTEKKESLENLESIDKNHEIRILSLENTVKKLDFIINDLNQDNIISKKIISLLKNDVNSLNEQITTNKKEIEILKRGLRSGIFEDQTSIDKQSPNNIGITMLPDMNEGMTILSDKNNINNQKKISSQRLDDPIGPTQLIVNAENNLRLSKYEEVILILDNLKKNYPNYDDKGRSLLLSSEAFLRLENYNNVFNDLKVFYIKYPNSSELFHAKLIEGEAFEKLNNKSKAAKLYQDVCSLTPQSVDCQNAKEGLLRMRDAK